MNRVICILRASPNFAMQVETSYCTVQFGRNVTCKFGLLFCNCNITNV